MSCDKCGAPCQGSRCATCEMIDANEARHGVPSDHMPDEDSDETESSDDRDEWTVEQAGIDGDAAGQVSLTGGVVRGDRDE